MKARIFSFIILSISICLFIVSFTSLNDKTIIQAQAEHPCFTYIEPFHPDMVHVYDTQWACYVDDLFLGYQQYCSPWQADGCWTVICDLTTPGYNCIRVNLNAEVVPDSLPH